jgi:hypothetical protein
MNWFGKKRQRVEPIERAKLLEMMAVGDDNPVLRGCVAILRGLQEQESAMQYSAKLTADERAYFDGKAAALEEGQQALLDFAQAARAAAGGKKQRA